MVAFILLRGGKKFYFWVPKLDLVFSPLFERTHGLDPPLFCVRFPRVFSISDQYDWSRRGCGWKFDMRFEVEEIFFCILVEMISNLLIIREVTHSDSQ